MDAKQKILIADDTEINRAMLKEILGDGWIWAAAGCCWITATEWTAAFSSIR